MIMSSYTSNLHACHAACCSRGIQHLVSKKLILQHYSQLNLNTVVLSNRCGPFAQFMMRCVCGSYSQCKETSPGNWLNSYNISSKTIALCLWMWEMTAWTTSELSQLTCTSQITMQTSSLTHVRMLNLHRKVQRWYH